MGRVKSFDAAGSATSPSSLATNVLFTGRVFDAETGLYYFRARYFEPELGVFVSRDPLGFVDGQSVYQGWLAVDYGLDASGLWKIDRKNNAKADAQAEAGDTLSGLANIIGLDIKDVTKWADISGVLSTVAGQQLQDISNLGISEAIKCGTITIPNSVYMFYCGDIGGLGQWWIRWGANKDRLTALGFHVDEVINDAGMTGQKTIDYFDNKTVSKEMHGFVTWGHGWEGGIATSDGLFGPNNQLHIYYSDLTSKLKYKLGLAILNVCNGGWSASDPGQVVNPNNNLPYAGGKDLVSGTPGYLFAGVQGVLCPVGVFGLGRNSKNVWEVYSGGEQGTKP